MFIIISNLVAKFGSFFLWILAIVVTSQIEKKNHPWHPPVFFLANLIYPKRLSSIGRCKKNVINPRKI
jgi:hypothetical protein